MEAGAASFTVPPPLSFFGGWSSCLFHLLDYIYCRIILHQLSHVRGFLSASPWVFILVVGFFRLLGTWDFRWESWGRLDLFLRVWVGGVTAFSLALLGRQVVWFFWGRRKVTYRLTRHEKVRAPFHPPMRFLEKFGIRNQLYDLSFLEYDLELPGWPIEWSGLSIAHISDVHHGKYVHDAYLAYVHRAVTAWHTDLIIFTGDFVGGKEDIPHAFEWLKGLKAEMGVWAVLGNHDGWSDPIKAAKGLKAAGIGPPGQSGRFFPSLGVDLGLDGGRRPLDGREGRFSA
jgi:hypothetical protein